MTFPAPVRSRLPNATSNMTLLGGVFLALAALYRCDAQTLFGVSTLVGGGSPGGTLAGHLDGVGTVALLNNPSFIAIAAGGEFALFVSSISTQIVQQAFPQHSPSPPPSPQTQTGNHLVRKISIWTKNVTTLAGNAGTNGYADGFGTSSRFNAPWGVAMGPQNSFAVIVRVFVRECAGGRSTCPLRATSGGLVKLSR